MSLEERRSIDNGIWLCASCHDRVDTNADLFPAELLRRWKENAEERARSRQGQRLITDSDAQQLVVASLGGAPRHLPRNAVAQLIGAMELELQSMDPRCDVRTSYAGNVFTHSISAKEPMRVSFTFDANAAPDGGAARAALRELMDHGSPVSLPAHTVSSSGSPLVSRIFESAAESGGVLRLEPRNRSATLKLSLKHPEDGTIKPLDDMTGTVAVGRRSLTYQGTGFDELLSLSFRKHFEGDVAIDQSTFFLDLDKWNGLDVRALPYIDKAAEIFQLLSKGWRLEMTLEIQGRQLLRGSLNESEGLKGYFQAVNALLSYSRRVGTLARHLEARVLFSSAVSFTRDEHEALAEAVDILEGGISLGNGSEIQPKNCRIQVKDAQVARLLRDEDLPTTFLLVAEEAESICVFGCELTLPLRQLYFEGARVVVVGGPSVVRVGAQVDIDLHPTTGSRCTWRYDVPAFGPWGSAHVEFDVPSSTGEHPIFDSPHS
ncbi:hypothetical protein V9L20_15900 [Variovorax sp. CCNWLW225]|uniref:hypothetical protein n=1 Tax=Variovorax sp. CCNWLW225 TaxID=3127462 RepID=UPI0030769A42